MVLARLSFAWIQQFIHFVVVSSSHIFNLQFDKQPRL